MIKPNCNQNGREIRFGETVVAKIGTAATNGWTDDAVAALIVQAVNEHAALVATAEVLKRIQTIPHFNAGSVESTRGVSIFKFRNELADAMREALANLAAVRASK